MHEGLRKVAFQIDIPESIAAFIPDMTSGDDVVKLEVENLNIKIQFAILGNNRHDSIVQLVIEGKPGCEYSCHNSRFRDEQIGSFAVKRENKNF